MVPAFEAGPQDQGTSLADLVAAIDAGSVQLLVILGENPVFTAPSDLKFAEKLGKVALVVYHGLYTDETAYLCHWNIPDDAPARVVGRSPRLRRHGDDDAAAHRAALRRSIRP